MGFIKKAFSAPKPQPVAAPVKPQESASQIEARQSKKNKQALLAANAGANSGALGGSGAAQVTTKTLLGL